MPLSVPAASRFSPRPSDTISGAETAGRPAACYSWPSDGSVVRYRLVMVIMRPLRLLAPCAPRIARRHAAHRIDDAHPFRFLMVPSLTRFCHARISMSPRLIDTGDGEPGGADTCLALRIG